MHNINKILSLLPVTKDPPRVPENKTRLLRVEFLKPARLPKGDFSHKLTYAFFNIIYRKIYNL